MKDLGKLIVAKVAQSAKNRPNLVTLVVPNVNAEAVLQDVSQVLKLMLVREATHIRARTRRRRLV